MFSSLLLQIGELVEVGLEVDCGVESWYIVAGIGDGVLHAVQILEHGEYSAGIIFGHVDFAGFALFEPLLTDFFEEATLCCDDASVHMKGDAVAAHDLEVRVLARLEEAASLLERDGRRELGE